ncbi:hypothetical protein PAXINDRAFT_48586, partial [Paxillus involutus ATCC 200175]
LSHMQGVRAHCLDRSARPRTITFDPTEYQFKCVLLRNNYEGRLHIICTSTFIEQIIIVYFQQKGFQVYCTSLAPDKNTHFDLVTECGNLNVVL